MHLHRLKLCAFRNLRDLEVRFSAFARDAEGGDQPLQSHAIIGPNGCGKSNLLEALVTIFRDLDLNQPPAFDYELDYEIRGYSVAIRATAGEPPRVQIDGEATDPFELSDSRREHPQTGRMERGKARRYLPSNVFTYYSGKNERLEALFREHQQAFIDNLNEVDADGDDATGFDDTSASDALVRRLFYCRHPHAKLVLLSLLLAPEQPLKEILDDLRIVDLDSALFVLKQPWRLTGDKLTREDVRQGSPRFWYDRTRFTEELLERLWEVAVAPIDDTVEQTIDFRGRVEEQALLYLFLDSRDKLMALKDQVGDSYRFFRFLEGAYIADLLEDLHLYVRHQRADGLMTFDQLSEGELQLLTVLGLMRLIHGSDWDQCLFLLDEPDTHLNPLWKLRYFERVEQVLHAHADGPGPVKSQIIVTTHDPMMIGSLRKEQVRILRPGHDGTVEVAAPDLDPRGMGFAGLLKSDLFGLRSAVDFETLRRLDRRNRLFAKGPDRTQEETAEMERLSDELSELGFARDFKDPYYALFVQKMAQHTEFHAPTLTPEQRAEQDAIAERIISEVLGEDDG